MKRGALLENSIFLYSFFFLILIRIIFSFIFKNKGYSYLIYSVISILIFLTFTTFVFTEQVWTLFEFNGSTFILIIGILIVYAMITYQISSGYMKWKKRKGTIK